MIPKIIHYCWFGGNPLPPLALECIASWRKYLPDYEIWQWVETSPKTSGKSLSPSLPQREGENSPKHFEVSEIADKVMEFDVNSIPYTTDAYRLKKYAFVSDYARFSILYNYGGVYFDTDVEVIRLMDDIIAKGPFMGFERDPDRWGDGLVNPGLGMAVEPNAEIIKTLVSKYDGLYFLKEDGSLNIGKTIVHYTTEVLNDLGMQQTKGIQELKGITLYPAEYFAPIDFVTKRLHIQSNTHTIHRYMASWGERKNKKLIEVIKHYLPEIVLVWINRLKNFRHKRK